MVLLNYGDYLRGAIYTFWWNELKSPFNFTLQMCCNDSVLTIIKDLCRLTWLVRNNETDSDCCKDHMEVYSGSLKTRKGSCTQQIKQPMPCPCHTQNAVIGPANTELPLLLVQLYLNSLYPEWIILTLLLLY